MLFERLMNLDVELRCLGTKAFVAKEQFVNDVFYPGKPKKKSSEDEDKKKVTKAEMSDLMDQIQKDKSEGKDTSKLEKELKEKMDEFLAPEKKEEEKPVSKEDISNLMDQIQKDKAEGKDTSELEKELKDKTEKFLSAPKTEKKEVSEPVKSVVVNPTPAVPDSSVTMDYSGQVQQPGVSYAEPSANPYIDEQKKAQVANQESGAKTVIAPSKVAKAEVVK